MAARRARRDPKQRLKSSLPALAVVCLVLLLGGALVQIDSLSPGRMDTQAADRIRKRCGAATDCTVRLGDVIPGTWDSFYEFSPAVSQDEVNRVLGTRKVRTGDLQRLLVLAKGGQVLRRQYAHTGLEQPLASEVEFSGIYAGSHAGWVRYSPDSLFSMTRCPTKQGGSAFGQHGGMYFLLTPVTASAGTTSRCVLHDGTSSDQRNIRPRP